MEKIRSREVPHASDSRERTRRHLAILFSDLSDSTTLSTAMEAEEYAALLERVRLAYEDVIPKHGGTLVQLQGDGLFAIFGYPDTKEDDGRRATEAAIELHERVRGIGPLPKSCTAASLTLHSGIHSGLTLLDGGDAVRGRFQLFGNAANIAHRISDEAGEDEILVSAETLGADRHFFQTGEARTLRLQGALQPVSVFRVLARAPIGTRLQARAQRGLVSFVGRRAELRTLEATLRATLAGKPAYLAIVGAAGMGKTRLVEEFLAGSAQLACQMHHGYCESYLSSEPLQPFLQMMRTMCGIRHGMSAAAAAEALEQALRGIDATLVAHLGVLSRALSLSAAETESGKRRAPDTAIGALRDIFGALAGIRPVLLWVDDWQWADDASRQALDAIRELDKPIFVLVGTREFAAREVTMRNARTLDLAPLTSGETGSTIRRMLPGIDPFVVSEIEDASGGNPLFLEELCHCAAVDGGERRIGRRQGGTAWLDTLIESRIERLTAAQAGLVRTAAVIGNVIPLWLLESLCGVTAEDPVIKALAEQDVIFPGEKPGTLRFKHGIARDVIYESVGLHQRRALHARIAELVQQQGSTGRSDEQYELLAYHYGAAGRAEEAAQFAELAGDKAMAASSLDRAQAQYQAALAALDQVEPTPRSLQRWSLIAQRFGMACVFDPSRDSLAVLQRAVAVADTQHEPTLLSRAEYWLGYVHYALGDTRKAIEHFERALEAADRVGNAALIAEIQATLGQAHSAACNYGNALSLLDSAITFKRRGRKGGSGMIGLAYSLACKASVLGDRGEFALADECFEEALSEVRGTGHEVEGSILCWRSAVLLWQGRWDEARESAQRAGKIAERVKSLYVYAMSVSIASYAQWIACRDASLLETLLDATTWLEKLDRRLNVSLNHGWLADAFVASERWDEARSHAARALQRARRHDRLGEAMACRAMARAAAEGHARMPAGHYLARALANAQARGSPHERAVTQLLIAQQELALGQLAQASASLAAAQAAFASMRMVSHAAQAARLRLLF